MRILVTGGAGFIGSHTVDALVKAGAGEVSVIDNLSAGKRHQLNDKARFHEIDLRDADAVRKAIASEKPEVIVHLAAQMDVRKSVADPAFDAQVNVVGFLNLLEAARQNGLKRVVFSSTGGAIYGEQDTFPAGEDHPARPVSPYGVGKLALERYLYFYHAAYGMAVTCLRYANVYGERQNAHGEAGVVAIFLDRLLAGRAPTINGSGLQTRDYLHVSDVVRANLAAAGRPGFHIYNVGTGIETTVLELYQALARAAGSALAPVHGPAKPGEQQRSVVDGRLIRRELGLPAPLPLALGLARTASWFRARAGTGTGTGGAEPRPAAGVETTPSAVPI